MIQERKRATPEAIERRRQSRKYKFKKDAHRRQQARTEENRRQKSLEDAFRLVERAIEIERARHLFKRALRGKETPSNDIRDLPEYWLLRHFGYDVRAKEHTEFTRTDGKIYFIAATETEIWKWWTGFDLSSLIREMKDGKTVRVCALRKLVAEQHPNHLITTVAEVDAATKKHVKYLAERNVVNPL